MTGTRARAALGQRSLAMELSPTPTLRLKEAADLGNRPSSASILRQPLTAPRSFVLATLRALHPDPVGGLTAACLYGGNGTQHQDDLLRRD
jgi:hypothetical protein